MSTDIVLVDVATKDLSGAALDWAVAQIEDKQVTPVPGGLIFGVGGGCPCRYSTDWSQGGPLLHKYRMSFATSGTGPKDEHGNQPIVAIGDKLHWRAGEGPTHLIAACRSIVLAERGDIVKVPACLVMP